MSMCCICGCSLFEEETNSGSDVALASSGMINDLTGYSYTVTSVLETGIMDMETTTTCNEDRVNKTAYCETSAYGTEEYVYYDYANGKMYQSYSTILGSSNEWTTYSVEFVNESNSFLNLGDYVFDLEKTETSEGTLYTGIIDSKKLAEATSEVESDISASDVISSDIEISILVNESGYIQSIDYELDVLGMTSKVNVVFSNFNSVNSIIISEKVN